MKQYDVKCPVCGTMNKGLYLGETDGWMICEHCGAEVRTDEYSAQFDTIPVYDMSSLSIKKEQDTAA